MQLPGGRFLQGSTHKMNFMPTKQRPWYPPSSNGIFRTQRTSANVGVLAVSIGVGTWSLTTHSIRGASSIRRSIPPEHILSERAFPLCPAVTLGANNFSSSSSSSACSGPSIVVVTSYGTVLINEYRSLCCCELGETVQALSSNGILHLARATNCALRSSRLQFKAMVLL